MREVLGTYNNIEVYKINTLYYYSIDGLEYNFCPYIVNGYKKVDGLSKRTIYDIKDFIDICDQYANDEFKNKIIEKISKYHEEDIDTVWKMIKYIEQIRIGQEKDDDKKEKSKKRRRPIQIPLTAVKDIKDIGKDEEIVYMNFYTTQYNNREYMIDIYRTNNNNFYVRIADVSDRYVEISVDELKKKTSIQLTIDFLDI